MLVFDVPDRTKRIAKHMHEGVVDRPLVGVDEDVGAMLEEPTVRQLGGMAGAP
jgi:hypothetical protein